MSRDRWSAAVALCALVAASACVDVCVLSGAPCDSAADCESGQVCRLRRSFELGCLFARGTCVDGTCGSVADCPEGACCDPDRNRCVASSEYQGSCDDKTCRDCPEPCLVPPCDSSGDGCSPLPDCSANGSCQPLIACQDDGVCPADRRCSFDRCRLICSSDEQCPGADCFAGETCTMPVGTPCADLSDCGGATCTDLNASNVRRASYCTLYCSEYTLCPCGFLCVDSECRYPE
ncbi:MAG: hypothetical protein JXR83_06225 [Deltaproteobacteria bacterium]|nr:hypothetical protein [Deltaproteobacteria bacterium]